MHATAPPSHITVNPTARRMRRTALALALAALLIGLLVTSVVFVDEAESVIVERLGQIVAVYDRPQDRGLHVKLPWPIDTVRRFDRRVQLFDPPGRELFTADKKNVTADAYLCWRIAEPSTDETGGLEARPVVRFFRSLGSAEIAEQRLDSRVRSILSTELGRVELGQLFSAADSESGPADDGPGLLERISDRLRENVGHRPEERQSLRERLGIEIVDARIQRINLPEGNRPAIYERMRSERRKIADQYRSAGLAESRVLRSQADRQAGELLARARADAERIRGEGEAQAIAVLNEAHALDPELARTLQTLDAYRTVLGKNTTLVLSASSNLLRLLTEGIPEPSPAPPPSPPSAGTVSETALPTEAGP